MLLPEPTPRRQPVWLAGFAIFAFALAVRLIGLTWGLPNAGRYYSYHPDESTRQIVGAVANMIQGDFNPHFFNYPSLSIYATWIFYQFLTVFGFTTNVAAPYPWPAIHDIILAGRGFSVVCGGATAPLVLGIARRLGMGRWAILAAVLAALAPGHVQQSHFATVDVPATFFVTLCLFLTLRATDWKGLAWAALVAGLAAGTKYNAGLVVIAPMVQAVLISGKKGLWTAGAAILVSIFGFTITTPYALLSPREFWGDANGNGFYFEAFVHPKIGSGEIFQGTGNGWWYHLSFNLPFLLTWPLVFAALIGIGFSAKRREFWPILAFAGLFFVSLGLSQVRFMRYLLPLAPLLCLMAALGASRLPKRLNRFAGAITAVFALWGTRDVLFPLTQTSPRDVQAALIRKTGGAVALAHAPWFYTPPFQPQGLNLPVEGVPLVGFDFGKLQQQKPRYFAVSEFEFREPLRLRPRGREAAFFDQLFANYSEVEPFQVEVPWALPGRDFVPQDFSYTNPEVHLFTPGTPTRRVEGGLLKPEPSQ